MSRVGKSPVRIPGGVSIDVGGNREVTVKGPGGTLTMPLRPEIEVEVQDKEAVVTAVGNLFDALGEELGVVAKEQVKHLS